jgi:hypothetical protein
MLGLAAEGQQISKVTGTRHVVKSTKNLETAQSPRARCPTGLFIAKDQEPYYNIMIVLNYLPRQ